MRFIRQAIPMRMLSSVTLVSCTVTIVALMLCHSSMADTIDCPSLGFSGMSRCSDCVLLSEYVQDEELVADCNKCCIKTNEDTGKERYRKATLEVCSFRLGAYRSVEEFVKKKAANFPNLVVRYKDFAMPKLIFTKPVAGQTKSTESIRIDQWKTEHIEEYLQERLVPDDGSVPSTAAE
eukprot:jgi/Mesvir1/7166/Mv02526-RA.1